MLCICRGAARARAPIAAIQYNHPIVAFARSIHGSGVVLGGFDDFFDVKSKPDDIIATGRAWTVPDLRRKSFDDLHKLWYVLYKERNLILSEKEKIRRSLRPVTRMEENRYVKVKKSMAAVKTTLAERKRIEALLLSQSNSTASIDKTASSTTS